MRLHLIGLILAASVAACASTPEATQTADAAVTVQPPANDAQATKVALDDPDREICKRMQVIGSKFNKKVCKTKAQWDHEEQVSRDITQGFRGRGRAGAQPGG